VSPPSSLHEPLFFQSADTPSVLGFAAILVIVLLAIGWAVCYVTPEDSEGKRPAARRYLFRIALFLAIFSAVVGSGLLPKLPLQGLPLMILPALVLTIRLGCSPLGRRLADGLPVGALIGFQAFRLPLELVLHRWATQGTIPKTMTWTGQNWDIVSGLLACAAAPMAHRSRAVASGFNLVGFALLANVMRVAMMSSPVPFGWGQQPPLLLGLHLPYALIIPVCVGGALLGHIVLTRALHRPAGA
jgi:hypothetical protein